MFKKIAALLLVLLLSLSAVACSSQDPDVPEDMQAASLASEPFRLFVPKNWIPNTASGVSGAYASTTQKIMVTARYYTPTAATTAEEYMALCAAAYEKALTSFKAVEQKAAVLGGQDAIRLNFTMVEDTVNLTCFQISTLYKGDIISLNGYCPTDLYASLTEEFDLIISKFRLRDKPKSEGAEWVDENTPAGMEIASGKECEYRFYVPKTWICNSVDGASEVYYPESGKSNVLVTSFVPDSPILIPNYFKMCEKDYATTLPEYERISEAQGTVAERASYTYTYRTVVDGVAFRISQTLFYYSDSIYSLTYTAMEENFDLHTEDVQAMLDAFTFR